MLSNSELLARVRALAEDERRLYLAEGCSSMFTYCTQILNLSEHAMCGGWEVDGRQHPAAVPHAQWL